MYYSGAHRTLNILNFLSWDWGTDSSDTIYIGHQVHAAMHVLSRSCGEHVRNPVNIS